MDGNDNQKGSPLDVNQNQQLDEQQDKRSKRQRKTKSFRPNLKYIWLKVIEMKFILVFRIYYVWKVTY